MKDEIHFKKGKDSQIKLLDLLNSVMKKEKANKKTQASAKEQVDNEETAIGPTMPPPHILERIRNQKMQNPHQNKNEEKAANEVAKEEGDEGDDEANMIGPLLATAHSDAKDNTDNAINDTDNNAKNTNDADNMIGPQIPLDILEKRRNALLNKTEVPEKDGEKREKKKKKVLTYERWKQKEKEMQDEKINELGLNDPNRPKSLLEMHQEKRKQQFDLEMKRWKKNKQGPMPVWNEHSSNGRRGKEKNVRNISFYDNIVLFIAIVISLLQKPNFLKCQHKKLPMINTFQKIHKKITLCVI
ncbi:hypothetical protein RFI_11116 [Reticulomyxa filosa]|uniref:Uncharacterized protein n=1 Tax=Reticulomyxa filosa TaxID=46433 RepID=X6NJD0_RETFI|nr:hypothetical protein RFI_11116 [Reticulomyxa filosa]|eukprot:ETO26023.1 hypothetical protein RFI_11116 [Reticulomyxa filosa]